MKKISFLSNNKIRLIISTKTNCVLARRFHKFFNIGELRESQAERIDFQGCKVYEKMDGSLVSPVLLDSNELIWVKRKLRDSEIENFCPKNYQEFSNHWLKKGITPLFEWCVSDKQPGILRYEKNKLVLLSLRDNVSGKYISLEEAKESINTHQIETPREYTFSSFEELKDKIDLLTDTEGRKKKLCIF